MSMGKKTNPANAASANYTENETTMAIRKRVMLVNTLPVGNILCVTVNFGVSFFFFFSLLFPMKRKSDDTARKGNDVCQDHSVASPEYRRNPIHTYRSAGTTTTKKHVHQRPRSNQNFVTYTTNCQHFLILDRIVLSLTIDTGARPQITRAKQKNNYFTVPRSAHARIMFYVCIPLRNKNNGFVKIFQQIMYVFSYRFHCAIFFFHGKCIHA